MIGDAGTIRIECPHCGCLGDHALHRAPEWHETELLLAPYFAWCIGCDEPFEVIP